MKTIFIPITRGLIVRNLLRTDAFEMLKNNPEIKFVFLVLEKAAEEFKKEFSGENIEIISIKSPKNSKLRSLFLKVVSRNLVWTDSSKILSFVGKFSDKKREGLFYKIIFNTIGFVGKFVFVKKIFRWFDFYFFPEKYLDYLFKNRKVDLLFLPDLQGGIDTALAKSARRYGVRSIGMTKGWDTLCQRLIRVLPDKLIVQSEPVKIDAIKYQNMPESRIYISGFPQFDLFFKKDWILERSEYCKKMGFDPARAILFFASSGSWTNRDSEVVKKICDCVSGNKFSKPASLIIRPHFSNVASKPYKDFYNLPNIYVDDKYTQTNFIDNWNPSDEDNRMLVNTLYHTDVLISYFSTLVLDAVVAEKPIINLAFGGQYDLEGKDVTERLFKRTHYQGIVKSGGVRMVYDLGELIRAVNEYFENPQLDANGRKIIKDHWCFGADGKSGERVAKIILNELDNNKPPYFSY